eukprot:8319899-Alexandrium_andersonii.AAC.1
MRATASKPRLRGLNTCMKPLMHSPGRSDELEPVVAPSIFGRGRFCAIVRADAESADEAGRRVRRRRFSG